MARIRTIKPEFCSSADVGALSRDARLFFLQLLTEADDYGRLLWLPKKLAGALYPHDEDVTPSMLTQWMQECAARGMVVHYRAGQAEILQVTNWSRHQRVDKPTASRLPDLSSQGVTRLSLQPPEILASNSRDLREELPVGSRKGNREEEREEEQSSLRSDSSSPSASTPAEPVAGEGATLSLVPPAPSLAKRQARIEQIAADAQSAYNAILAKPNGLLPLCAVINKPRRKAVEKALPTVREICKTLYRSERITPEFWTQYFEEAARDDWHSGRTPGGPGHENWKPDFEYLLREGVIAKLFDRAMTDAVAA